MTATTSFKAGYVCEPKKVKKIKDEADKHLTLYQVDMSCQMDGLDPVPATRVKSLWAIRKTTSGDVLVIATIPDAIELFHREN